MWFLTALMTPAQWVATVYIANSLRYAPVNNYKKVFVQNWGPPMAWGPGL